MSNPHPLDAAARDELARDFTPVSADEAQSFLAHARKDFTSEANELGYVPVQPHDLERLSLTILALIAQARAGGEDTAPLRAAVDAFLAKHPAQIGSKSYGSFVTAADLWALHEARLTARRDMEMSMPAFADLPPESRAELEEFAAHLRQHRDVAKLDCRFCLLRLQRAARSATPTEGEDHA